MTRPVLLIQREQELQLDLAAVYSLLVCFIGVIISQRDQLLDYHIICEYCTQ